MIRIENLKNDRFTVSLMRKSGEPFVKIHGCKVMEHNGKSFVSGPAWKGNDNKWVNYTWIDDAMQSDIIAAYRAAQGTRDTFQEEPDVPF
jgi:hypothetical protein